MFHKRIFKFSSIFLLLFFVFCAGNARRMSGENLQGTWAQDHEETAKYVWFMVTKGNKNSYNPLSPEKKKQLVLKMQNAKMPTFTFSGNGIGIISTPKGSEAFTYHVKPEGQAAKIELFRGKTKKLTMYLENSNRLRVLWSPERNQSTIYKRK